VAARADPVGDCQEVGRHGDEGGCGAFVMVLHAGALDLHGLTASTESSTAVLHTARSSRYAFAAVSDDATVCMVACQRRTDAVVRSPRRASPMWGAM
jgi:hypothetical protein